MAAFCLPKQYTEAFRQALKSGELSPGKLRTMTTEERRGLFSKMFGDDLSGELNLSFEKRLLLKDQQTAMKNWVNDALGLNEVSKKTLVDKIQRMDRILNPVLDREFLADLAHKKLGTSLTVEEARQVFDLSRIAKTAKDEMLADLGNTEKQIAYGNAVLDLSEKVNELKGRSSFDIKDRAAIGRSFMNLTGIPKTLMSSIDLSAPFIQGWGMVSTRRFWEGFAEMFKYFSSEKNFRNLDAYIVSHPNYELARSGKLGITELGENVLHREESFQSNIVEDLSQKFADWSKKNTGLPMPNPFRASARAFTGFLNYVRFQRFNDLIEAARLSGEDIRPGSQAVKDIAKVINDFTGRGALGKGDRNANLAPILNNIFFSPRKLSATINMFNPDTYLRSSPTARKAAMRQLVGSLVATGSVIALVRSMGADVDLDPRSQDFAKIIIGKQKYDITGGNAIYNRLLVRLLTGQIKTSQGEIKNLGEGYKAQTRMDLILGFLRGKLSPVAATIVDALYGQDAIGRPFELSTQASEKLVPMTIQNFMDFSTSGETGVVPSLLSLTTIFGINMQSPFMKERVGLTPWGDSASTPLDETTEDLNEALSEAGYNFNNVMPPDTINGVKLTTDEYKDYIQMSGHFSKAQLAPLIHTPEWENLPKDTKLRIIKSVVNTSRKQAQDSIMIKNQKIFEGKR